MEVINLHMNLRFCPQCGLSVENQPWAFCPACGYPLRDSNATTTSNPGLSNSTVRPPSKPIINPDILQRAYAHFQQAQQYLQQAYDKLRGAKGWSTVDILGGGFFTDLIKHSKVDDARHIVELAVQQLNAGYQLVPNAPRIRFARVHQNNFIWDVFFDNIFSDWSAREKISQSLRSVEEAIQDTGMVLNWLQQQMNP